MSRTTIEAIDPTEWIDPSVRDAAKFVDRRNFMKATGIAAMLGAAGPSQVGAQQSDQYYKKTRPTVFTDEDRENAFDNIKQYDWAADIRDAAVAHGDAIVEAWDLEDLWRLVPSQNIPRSYILSPWISYVTTTDWSFDLIDNVGSVYATAPSFNWELTNTVEIDDEERVITIPTNDFSAYRESGRDDTGQFDPDLADDSLLVNTKHPELGADWGVDDGTGFIDHEGYLRDDGADTWWNPVAWLNHWAVIYGMRRLCVELSNAYLYTGNEKYATPAAVILDRIGDVYPDLSLFEMYETVEHAGADDYGWAAFYNSDGGTLQGKYVGSIWESYQIREQLRNYDKVFPGMDGNDELVGALSSMETEFPGIGDKSTVGAIRKNTETGFLHEMLPAFKNAQIRGNFGFHQQTLAVAAVAADYPEGMTGDAIDYVFQPGTLLEPEDSPTGRWYITGGDILGFLVGSPQSGYMVDEDGYPSESAPHYNTSQQASLEGFAETLRGYDAYAGADLYENPKFKRAVDSHWQLTFGKYIPQIANTHGAGNPKAVAGSTPKNDRVIQNVDFALTGFDEYRTTELAQWTYMLNGLTTDGLQMGIFHPNPVGIREDIQAVIDEHGPFPDLMSNQQTGYGFTGLRDGDPDSPRGVYQYYGRNYWNFTEGTGVGSAHIHFDTHNLGVYGYDLDLSPELGRQGNDWEGNNLDAWVESTPAHNTVTVDGENINSPQWVGFPRHFDHTDRVQLMDIESRYAYEQTDEYRRTTAMVNVDEDTSYVADFFRVDGGINHHFSFHAMTSQTIDTEGLNLEAQDGGTYEGETVDFGDGGLFSYLYDVERDNDPGTGFSVDWDIGDYWNVRDDGGDPVHLRLTMLNDDLDDVAMATGRPAEQETENNPKEFPFVLAHRGREIEIPDPEIEYGDSVGFGEGIDPTNTSAYGGVKVTANVDLEGFRVQIDPDTDGITHATIRDTDNNILADRDVSGVDPGDYVDIPYDRLDAGTSYLVTLGAEGDIYQRNDSTADYPAETDDFTVTAGVYYQTSTTTSYRYNVTEIQAILDYEEPEVPEPDPIASTFTSVIEPYEGDRVVQSSELVPVTSKDEDADIEAVQAVKVDLIDGRTDYVISSTDTESKYEIDDRLEFKGAFAVFAEQNGDKLFSYTNDALLLTPDGKGSAVPLDKRSLPRITGTVQDFTKDLSLENELEVKIENNPRGKSLSQLQGEYVYVDPAPHDTVPEGVREDRRYSNEARDRRNGVFRINGVERTGPDSAVIDIGEHTPIRRFFTNDPADGYSYSIEEGAEFVIPLGRVAE